MQPCQRCQAVIDEYLLDKHLEPLRELTADDFNLCADCTTVEPDACVVCGNGVYVPSGEGTVPDYCPACRSDLIGRTGDDPGWHAHRPSA